jgi:voltage-gated potassium channel
LVEQAVRLMLSLPMPEPSFPKKPGLSVRRRLHRFFQRPGTELVIGGLIVASVGLTIMELSIEPSSPTLPLLERTNNAITLIFAIELTLRLAAAPSQRRFWGEFWLDVAAVAVSVLALRTGGSLNPLRMLRLLRLVGLLGRFAGLYHYVVRRAALEVLIASGLILLTVISGSAALLTFEKLGQGSVHTYGDAFWASIYSLFAGEPIPAPPHTMGGRVVMVVIMFMGMSTFAMFTGTVSAYMVNRLRSRGDLVDPDDLKDHLILCGWNRKAEIIAHEWLVQKGDLAPPVAVIAELSGEPTFTDNSIQRAVTFINDDFTKVSALERAGVRRASTCVILSDESRSRSEHDADARTILAALTIERLNPKIYTCAELNNEEYSPHLRMANVNDFIVTGEHNAFLLAQAAMNCGLTAVFSELLTHKYGNSFYRRDVPKAWIGRTFFDLLVFLKEKHDAILIGVRGADGATRVNPEAHVFKEGEQIVLIARKDLEP